MTSLSGGFSVRTQGGKPRQQRRDTRIESPIIRLQIEGKAYRTVNWGLGGVLIAYDGFLREGDAVNITGIGLEYGGLVRVEVPARVVRVCEGAIAAQYTALDGYAYDVLEALFMRRLSRVPALAAAAA